MQKSRLKRVLFSTIALVSVSFCSIAQPGPSLASDFSANPFKDAEKELEKSRSFAPFLNTGTNTYTPPQVIIGSPASSKAVDDTTSGGTLFSSPLPAAALMPGGYFGGYSPGASLFGGGLGYGGLPGYGFGYMNPALGLASMATGRPLYGVGPIGYGGFGGYGGLGGYGGFRRGFLSPYRGYGYGLGGWNPAGSALMMGAFGNSWMAGGSEHGDMGASTVYQSAPSKSSGNYYAPSTSDPSASGNYYSSSGPSVNMPIKPYTTPKDYWGQSGSPLPKDINQVPW